MCWVTFIKLLQLSYYGILFCVITLKSRESFSFMRSTCFLFYFLAVFFFFSVGNMQKEMCNRSTLCFIQRKNKACVLDGSSLSSGFITSLRTDFWFGFWIGPKQKHLVIITIWWTFLWPRISQWTVICEWAIVWTLSIISGTSGHICAWMELWSFSLLFLSVFLFLSFCDGEQDALTSEWEDSLSSGHVSAVRQFPRCALKTGESL